MLWVIISWGIYCVRVIIVVYFSSLLATHHLMITGWGNWSITYSGVFLQMLWIIVSYEGRGLRRVYFRHRFGAQSSCPWVVLPPTINHQCQTQARYMYIICCYGNMLWIFGRKKEAYTQTHNNQQGAHCQSYCILEGHYNSKQFLKNVSAVNLPTTLNVYYVLVSLHSGFCASLFIIK